jgi:hypothetical protein
MQTPEENDDELAKRIDEIVSRGPSGAFAVAGVATFLVVAMFFLFYFVVYLPRGTVQ